MADTEEETNGTVARFELPAVRFATTRSTVHWGARGIAPIINRTIKQTEFMLTHGRIRCARKVGGRWCAGDAALRAEFGIEVAS